MHWMHFLKRSGLFPTWAAAWPRPVKSGQGSEAAMRRINPADRSDAAVAGILRGQPRSQACVIRRRATSADETGTSSGPGSRCQSLMKRRRAGRPEGRRRLPVNPLELPANTVKKSKKRVTRAAATDEPGNSDTEFFGAPRLPRAGAARRSPALFSLGTRSRSRRRPLIIVLVRPR